MSDDKIIQIPGYAIPVSTDDRLTFFVNYAKSALSVGTGFIYIAFKYCDEDGTVHQWEDTMIPNATLDAVAKVQPLTKGYLLSVSMLCQGLTLPDGLAFARITLERRQSPFFGHTTLVAGSLTTVALGWPNNTVQPAILPESFVLVKALTNPAAGADIIFNPGDRVHRRIQSIQARLTTSAVAGNRLVSFLATSPTGQPILNFFASVVQGPNLVYQYQFAVNMANRNNALAGINFIESQMPSFSIEGNHQIKSSTLNLDAGDQWSNIFITYQASWSDPGSVLTP